MASPPEASSSELDSESRSTRVLLIDDDKDFMELAVRFLREVCIDSIDAVNSGEEALACLTGIESGDAMGRPFSPESTSTLSEIRGKVEDMLKGRVSPHSQMPSLDCESGKTKYFEVGYFPVPDEKGQTSAGMVLYLTRRSVSS